jgi:hypothetical protein
MQRKVYGFRQDEAGEWVVELSCGHQMHVRHDPPWQLRPCVLTAGGRATWLGQEMGCRLCDGPGTPGEEVDVGRSGDG